MKKYQAVGNNIIVAVSKQGKSAGAIYLPEAQSEFETGTVLSIGAGKDAGEFSFTETVLYRKAAGILLEKEGTSEVRCVPVNHVLASISYENT